jgi:hypothetical protein
LTLSELKAGKSYMFPEHQNDDLFLVREMRLRDHDRDGVISWREWNLYIHYYREMRKHWNALKEQGAENPERVPGDDDVLTYKQFAQ